MGSKQIGGRHRRQSRSSTAAVLPEEGRNIGEQTKPVQWLAFRGEAFVAAGNRRAPSRPWRVSRCTSLATVRFGEPLRSRSSGSPRAAQRVFGTRIRAHRRADLMASGTGSHADVKRRSFRDRAQIENPRAVPHLGGRGFILQRFVILRARQGRDKSWTSEYTAGAKRPTTPFHQVDLRLSCTLHYLFCYSGKYDLRLDLSQASPIATWATAAFAIARRVQFFAIAAVARYARRPALALIGGAALPRTIALVPPDFLLCSSKRLEP